MRPELNALPVDPGVFETLVRLEYSLLDPDVRRCPEKLHLILHDDFREFGSSGRIFDVRALVKALQNEVQFEAQLSGFEALSVAPGVVLLTYQASVHRQDSETTASSWRSSIWVETGNHWRLLFHQGTPRAPQTT